MVEHEGRQPGEEQDAEQGGEHGERPDGGLLHAHAVLQRAPGELKDDGKTYGVLAQQDPQNQPDDVPHESAVTVGDSDEEHGDQVGEDEGVGDVGAQDPEEQRAVGVEGDGGPQDPHHHHRDADHPLHFPVGRLRGGRTK